MKTTTKTPVKKATTIKHYITERASGWIRPFGGTSASSKQIEESYLGKKKYGTSFVQSIIDIRSSFISGEGLIIKEKQGIKAEKELEYINKVINYNQINEMLSQLTVLTEIEGKLLGVIEQVNIDNLYNIKIFPFNMYAYKAVQDEDDPQIIKEITYTGINGKQQIIKYGEFTFRNFGSSLWYKPNDTNPRIASVMEYIENLDRASQDLREVNHLFASPTPYFKCASQTEVQSLSNAIKDMKWTIGKILVTTADYSLVETNNNAVKSIIDEMVSLSERISGSTGVPIYFLGMSRLLNNRATALAMLEQLENSIKKERNILISWFNELFFNILTKSNTDYGTNYNINSIECDIIRPAILDVDQQVLAKLIDLYDIKAISLKTLLNYVPEVENPDEEISLISENNGVINNE